MNYLQKLIEVEIEAKEFGFDWPDFQIIIDQAIDECREIQEVLDLSEPASRLHEEIGDLLHTAISMCRYSEVSVNEILENTYKKFKRRITALKYLANEKGYKTLRNQSIEIQLSFWHEAKLSKISQFKDQLLIREMTFNDIDIVTQAFVKIGWDKSAALFENYLSEQSLKERAVKLAFYDGEFAGYVTLKWNSNYQYFANENIPEIKDLNVLPKFRRNGIGARLIEECEDIAYYNKKFKVGIGVGLGSEYGQAQRLYIRKGYKPDGNGITYDYRQVYYGQNIPLDDNLGLWFIKELK